MPYKELELETGDFGHSLSDQISVADAVKLANRAIENRLTDCPRVYGFVIGNGFPSYRWYRKPWAGSHGKSDYEAYLVRIRKYRK